MMKWSTAEKIKKLPACRYRKKNQMTQNPIYKAVLDQWKKNPASSDISISAADTAKLIRSQLKDKFPGMKFSVRTSTYSGGASITIEWTDGPTAKMVEKVSKTYGGAGFDGMTDYKYSVGAWLMPNGEAVVRSVEAHHGCDGETIEAQRDGSIAVSFHADYVFCKRRISFDAMDRSLKSYAHRHPGDDLAEAIKRGEVYLEQNDWGYSIAGNPSLYRGIGEGSQLGGDCVLRNYAARRMVATPKA